MIDLHSDIPLDVVLRRRRGERRVLATRHLPRWREGDVGGAILTVGGDMPGPDGLLPEDPFRAAAVTLEALLADIEETPGVFRLIHSPDDLQAAQDGEFLIWINLEGAAPLGEDPETLDLFWRMGLRCLGLVWNVQNAVGSGVRGGDGGLTCLGRRVIRQAQRRGVLIDLSHANSSTFYDACEITEAPLMVSHANLRSIHDHPRNLTDDQCRQIAATGGLIGISCYPGFVGPGRPTVANVVDHILRAVELVGEDYVGIGADFIDFAAETIQGRLEKMGNLYGNDHRYPLGVEDTTELRNIAQELLRRGVDPALIRKILYGNFLRVFTAAFLRA